MGGIQTLAKVIRDLVVENNDLQHQVNILTQTNEYLEKQIKKMGAAK